MIKKSCVPLYYIYANVDNGGDISPSIYRLLYTR